MKIFATRKELQKMLECNPCFNEAEGEGQVYYRERAIKGHPDNWVIYYRMPAKSSRSDNTIHMRKVLISVVHVHRLKLDSVEEFMLRMFGVEPTAFDIEQPDVDYYATYYELELFTSGVW
ncbi:MAG: hypothetical protein FWE51_01535 [Coriobacteriia bacterium]|nr:hypothetical protein [Coriobacteriia bacterium]